MEWYSKLRWILLTAGVVAILVLTGMNIYSLYALHENALESNRQPKKLQVTEFTDKVRYRFLRDFWGLGSADIKRLKHTFDTTGQFTDEVSSFIKDAATDSIFSSVYFIPSNIAACNKSTMALRFDASQGRFINEANYPQTACDGMGMARTRTKAIIQDYRFNYKVIFDTHRSATVAIVDLSNRSVFGYVVCLINQRYLTKNYLPKLLRRRFGNSKEAGMHIWIRDWTSNKIIAGNDSIASYNKNNIQYEQSFPDIFNNWKIEVAFTPNSDVRASNATLFKNLLALGAAVILLLGTLLFMFIIAQKERALAERQAAFLANVTHELKTPLALMQAAGENLSDGRVHDQKRLKNYGKHIYNESLRLREMIDKLLDVAKATNGHSSKNETQVLNMVELVRNYIRDNRSYIEDKGFKLDSSIKCSEATANVNARNIDTILNNLVENALKYSNEDQYIGISVVKEDDTVILEVADHGIGISRRNVSEIFNKFYRIANPLTTNTKGHGLGLSIVRNLVELNAGTITVNSKKGAGSTFIIKFPIIDTQPQNFS